MRYKMQDSKDAYRSIVVKIVKLAFVQFKVNQARKAGSASPTVVLGDYLATVQCTRVDLSAPR